MKKLIASIAVLLSAIVISTGNTQAYEGSFELTGDNVACKATSVWHESRYRVIGRCDGLVYPYKTQYEYYTIWAHDVARDSYVRIDDIDRGYFEGDTNGAFDKLMISAEQDGGPRRPSEFSVASGNVNKFSFDKSQVTTAPESTKTTTDTTNKTMTVQNATTKAATTASTAGSVIGRIITSLLVIILVVVGIVIVGSLLFRKRGSVSA